MSYFSSFHFYIQQSHSTAKIHAFDVASGVQLANLSIVPHVPMISQPEILSFCCAIEKGKRTRSITMPCRKTKSNPQELKTYILGKGLYSTNQVFLTRHQLSFLIPELHFHSLRNGRMLEHRRMWDTERIDSGAPLSQEIYLPKQHSCKYKRIFPVSEKIKLKAISGISIDIDPPLREVGGDQEKQGRIILFRDCVMSIFILMNGAGAHTQSIIRTKDWKDQ